MRSRGSSVNFQPVKNFKAVFSHNNREYEPKYLLPIENRVTGANDVLERDIIEQRWDACWEAATGQAKAKKNFSPFSEGVMNLREDIKAEEARQQLETWTAKYEEMTGRKVLGWWVHLDEGFKEEDGEIKRNSHAHILIDRMDEQNKVIRCEKKDLIAIQNMTAEVTGLERGGTKSKRKHLHHSEYKAQVNNLKIQIKEEFNEKLAKELEKIESEYKADRARLIASGEAKQQDYIDLKRFKNEAIEKLKNGNSVFVTDGGDGENMELAYCSDKDLIERKIIPDFRNRISKIDPEIENKEIKKEVEKMDALLKHHKMIWEKERLLYINNLTWEYWAQKIKDANSNDLLKTVLEEGLPEKFTDPKNANFVKMLMQKMINNDRVDNEKIVELLPWTEEYKTRLLNAIDNTVAKGKDKDKGIER